VRETMRKKKSCQGISLVEQPSITIKSVQANENRNSFKSRCGRKQAIAVVVLPNAKQRTRDKLMEKQGLGAPCFLWFHPHVDPDHTIRVQ
jgi:hypothetical protein